MSDRLTPEDWIAAGFRALCTRGPSAIKAEALARDLGTTKGSFYWHFKDVSSFHADMFALWKSRAMTDIIEALEDIPTPQARLRALAARASSQAPEQFGGALVEPAIRAWAMHHPQASQAVSEVDAGRMRYLEELLVACARPKSWAVVIYATYLGQDDLQSRGHGQAADALALLVDQILA